MRHSSEGWNPVVERARSLANAESLDPSLRWDDGRMNIGFHFFTGKTFSSAFVGRKLPFQTASGCTRVLVA